METILMIIIFALVGALLVLYNAYRSLKANNNKLPNKDKPINPPTKGGGGGGGKIDKNQNYL